MTLADYLRLEGNSATALAALCGVEVSTISRAARGDTLPSRSLMADVFRHTGGRVTPNDFFDLAATCRAVCDVCELRAEEPQISSCTDTRCPMRQAAAA